jgi:hypothetical protein
MRPMLKARAGGLYGDTPDSEILAMYEVAALPTDHYEADDAELAGGPYSWIDYEAKRITDSP